MVPPSNKIDGAVQIFYTVPGPVYFGTKTAIEALTGIQSGAFAIGYTTTLADGQFGFYDGSAWRWDTGGGGGTPGGSDTEVQVNDSGAFAGYSTFRRQANGAIVIGDIDEDITIEPYSIGQGADGSSIANFLESFGTGVASFIALLRARGTHDAPEAVQNGDVIGRIRGRAHDGSAWSNTQLEIRLVADGDWSTGDHPARIEIYTTPDGSDTLTLAMTIKSDQNINIPTGKEYQVNGAQHTHDAGNIVSGTMATARLGSGTASATTSLHGDQTYKTVREVLTADRTYYVRTDGSDSNNGLTNTAGGAFLTIQKAIDTAVSLDLSTYNVTIQVGDGTYNVTGQITLKSYIGAGEITIQGNSSTPTNVNIVTTTMGFSLLVPAVWTIKDLKITCGAGYYNIQGNGSGATIKYQNINFPANSGGYHVSSAQDALVYPTGNYTIAGGAAGHLLINKGKMIYRSYTVTISGTPAFSNAFLVCVDLAYILSYSMTFSGSATGKRYVVESLSLAQTYASGANYFPGNSAGSTATGAQYL